MLQPFDDRSPGNRQKEIVHSQREMDPHLKEVLDSATSDHVFDRGTGMYEMLITSLEHHLKNPKNAPFVSKILNALVELRDRVKIDPLRAKTRRELRKVDPLLNDILGPRGPMELE